MRLTLQIFNEGTHVAALSDLEDDVGRAAALLAGVGEAAGVHDKDAAAPVGDRAVRVAVDQDVSAA